MKVHLTTRAARDLAAAVDHYLDVAPGAAPRFADAVEHMFLQLSQFPASTAQTQNPAVRRAVLQEFPYVIFYRVRRSELSVVHIRHAARKPRLSAHRASQ